MKNPIAFLKIFVTAGFFSFLLFSAGSLRCEPPPNEAGNFSPQVKRSDTVMEKNKDQSWLSDQEAKSDRFKELEWLIKRDLLKKYEKLETSGYMGDDSD
ncbi:MAG: hypothetical protein M1438_03210 [Deltaproteobacteria bacterium]|nr:hypothetical protein [Deltaproteobacteria bacterium]